VFSVKEKIFAPQTTKTQYRPKHLGGNGIKSVKPGTKPGLQWCPTGLTPTKKRWVQRLRASQIREEKVEKKGDARFNRDKPMTPLKMTWKEKRITTEENINADDMVADGISEISRDALTDMDVHQGG
jgi:hypothetical protein